MGPETVTSQESQVLKGESIYTEMIPEIRLPEYLAKGDKEYWKTHKTHYTHYTEGHIY